MIDFTNTKAALDEWWYIDRPKLDEMSLAVSNDKDVEAWLTATEAARLKVCDAFYEDTKEINSLEKCRLCDPFYLQRVVGWERKP